MKLFTKSDCSGSDQMLALALTSSVIVDPSLSFLLCQIGDNKST